MSIEHLSETETFVTQTGGGCVHEEGLRSRINEILEIYSIYSSAALETQTTNPRYLQNV